MRYWIYKANSERRKWRGWIGEPKQFIIMSLGSSAGGRSAREANIFPNVSLKEQWQAMSRSHYVFPFILKELFHICLRLIESKHSECEDPNILIEYICVSWIHSNSSVESEDEMLVQACRSATDDLDPLYCTGAFSQAGTKYNIFPRNCCYTWKRGSKSKLQYFYYQCSYQRKMIALNITI